MPAFDVTDSWIQRASTYTLIVSGVGFFAMSWLGGLFPWHSFWYTHTIAEFSMPATLVGGLTVSFLGYYVLEKDRYHRPIGLVCVVIAFALTVGMIVFSAAWAFTHQPESKVLLGRAGWYEYSSPAEFAKIVTFYTIRTGMVLPLITTTAAGTALALTGSSDQEEPAR